MAVSSTKEMNISTQKKYTKTMHPSKTCYLEENPDDYGFITHDWLGYQITYSNFTIFIPQYSHSIHHLPQKIKNKSPTQDPLEITLVQM